MKFFVLKGVERIVGINNCEYQIYDVVDFHDSDNLYNQMRKYSYREFFQMGAPARTMRHEVYYSEKNITLKDGRLLSHCDVFHHTHSYFMFVDAEDFKV